MHRIDVVLGTRDREGGGRREGEEKVHEREPRSQSVREKSRKEEEKRENEKGGNVSKACFLAFVILLNDDSHAPMHVICVDSHQV